MSERLPPQPPSERRGDDRRTFLVQAGRLTFGAALAAAVFHGPLRALYAGVVLPTPDHEPLAGACVVPQSEQEKTVAALVDTVVPGRQSDPTGQPGALDACALNLIYDQFYPFVDSLPIILLLLGNLSRQSFGKTFVELSLTERTAVLTKAEDALPLVRLAYRFIRSTFYASSYNMVGARYLGWPGPNLGYTQHPDFTFGKAVSQELTPDGNLP